MRHTLISMSKTSYRLCQLCLAFLFITLINTTLSSQCTALDGCQLCDVFATINTIDGATIVTGETQTFAPIEGGSPAVEIAPLVINASGCGEVRMTVDLAFDWGAGTNNAFFHGISMDASTAWSAATGEIFPPSEAPNWHFLPTIQGACSNEIYGAGFYYDPAGTDIFDTGNSSSILDPSLPCILGQAQASFEETSTFLVDGDPSDNWGVLCGGGVIPCPSFQFELVYCPTADGDVTESVTFNWTEDGETGGYGPTNGCNYEITIPITIQNSGFVIDGPAEDQDICIGECIELVAGSACIDGSDTDGTFVWDDGMGGTTFMEGTPTTNQSIMVCPTESTNYTVNTTTGAGCDLSDDIMVNVSNISEPGVIITTSPQCPGSTIDISVSGENIDLDQYILIVDGAGNIVQVTAGNIADFTDPNCSNYTAFSFNFSASTGILVPSVGMPIANFITDCLDGCCEMVSEPISFEDTEAPQFVDAPVDMTVSCIDDIPTLAASELDWTDNCDMDNLPVAPTESGASDMCNGGVITRTWEVMDDCGNPATHTQNITVDPIDPPMFTMTPADMNIPCDQFATFTPDMLDYTNGATGSCEIAGTGVVGVIQNQAVDQCGGSFEVLYEVTVDCFSTLSITQTITVDPPPAATFDMLPPDMDLTCEEAAAFTPATLNYDNGLTGNCQIFGTVTGVVVGSIPDCQGTFQVMYESPGECSTTPATHMQTFTVLPPEAPMLMDVPADMTVSCNEPSLTDIPTLTYTNGLTGDCLITGMITPTETANNVTDCQGTITFNWFLDDPCFGTIDETMTVTVEPPAAPIFEAVSLPTEVSCENIPDLTTPPSLSYDNGDATCPIMGDIPAMVTQNFDPCTGGMIEYLWEFTDECGRTITQMHTTVVMENPDPTATVMDGTISCDEVATFTPETIMYSNGAIGTCLVEGSVTGVVQGDIPDCGGSFMVNFDIPNACNEINTITQTITVEMPTAPTIMDVPADVTVNCMDEVVAFTTLSFTNGLTDGCMIAGTVDPTVEDNTIGCSGTMIATWTIDDPCFGMISETSTITFEPPTEASFEAVSLPTSVTCDQIPDTSIPVNLAYNNNDTTCPITGTVPGMVDPNFDPCMGGTISYTWEFTDECDRTIMQTHETMVEAIPDPTFTLDMTPSISCDEAEAYIPETIDYSNGQTGTCLVEGSATGVIVGDVPTCGGSFEVNFEIPNGCGDLMTVTQTVTVVTPAMPTFIDIPADMTVNCSAIFPNFEPLNYSNNDTDGCLIAGSASPDVDPQVNACEGTITATWSFIDDCFGEITATSVVTLVPPDVPTFDPVTLPASATCDDIPDTSTPPSLGYSNGSTDCLIEGSIEADVFEDYDLCGGQITYDWVFLDECGREITEQHILTVEPAPQATFENFPANAIMSCEEYASFTPAQVSFSNGSTNCPFNGVADMSIDDDGVEFCGGDVFIEYSFIDACGATVIETQVIEVTPPPMASFDNLPLENVDVSCSEDIPDPIDLTYSNGINSGSCAIFGGTPPIETGSVGACGGTLSYTWTFTDACNRTINYTQNINVSPGDDAMFINPPADITLDCGEDFPDVLPLDYTNNATGVCAIEGTTFGTIVNELNGVFTIEWSFTNPCSMNEIIETQQITTSLEVEFEETNFDFAICEGESFDLSTVVPTDNNGVASIITYHTALPGTPANEITNPIVTPSSNEIYFVVGNTEFDCPDDAEIFIEVETPLSAGEDNSDVVCNGTESIDLDFYLSTDAADSGTFIQQSGDPLVIPSDNVVNISTAPAGIYTFDYVVPATANCDEDIALITIEILPELMAMVDGSECSADFNTYTVTLNTFGNAISVSEGSIDPIDTDNVEITGIDISNPLTITIESANGECTETIMVNPPNCNCPSVAAPEAGPNQSICFGEDNPELTVTTEAGVSANWYDADPASGGTLLLANSNTFTPDAGFAAPGPYTFFVEGVSMDNADCVSSVVVEVSFEILELPNYSNQSLAKCDDDADGLVTWEEIEFTDAIGLSLADDITFHESMADAETESNGLALPYMMTQANNQVIFASITNPVGCRLIVELELNVNAQPSITTQSTDVSCLGAADGSITISDFDGFATYTLNGNEITTDVIGDLEPAIYTLVVTNQEGCTNTEDINISNGLEIILTEFTAVCDPNGTDTDASDDQYVITFTVNNNNTDAGTFSITDDLANNYGPFNYGIENTFTIDAQDGLTLNYTFMDTDRSCSVDIPVGPLNSCSSTCSIMSSDLVIECNDNGTTSDPDDDVYNISFSASAVNGAAGYTVSLGGSIIDAFDYGEVAMLTLPANGDNVTLVLTDSADQACFVNVPLGILSNCSSDCVLEETISVSDCSDGGTGETDADDEFSFTLLLDGQNIGANFSSPELSFSGAYGVEHNFGPFLIADGVITFTVVDELNPGCTATYMVTPPASCSACSQVSSIDPPLSITCDQGDVMINLNVSEPGTYTWTGPGFSSTDEDITVSEPGTYTVDIVYPDGCTGTESVDITSDVVDLDAVVTATECQDNGTDADNNDDIFFFNIIVSNTSGATGYDIPVLGASGNYNVESSQFGPFNISNGSFDIEIFDADNPECSFTLTVVPPSACSNCIIEPIEVTQADETCAGLTDGSITILNFNTDFDYTLDGNPITSGDISDLGPGTYTIVSTDQFDCSETAIVEIEAGLMLSTPIVTFECNNGGTDTDAADDFQDVTFILNNDQGDVGSYTVTTSGGDNLGSFPYGVLNAVVLNIADGSTLTLTFTDDANACELSSEIGPLLSCSSNCTLTLNSIDGSCSLEGTDTDPSDDIWSYTINISSVNGSASGFNILIDGTPISSGAYDTDISFDIPADGSSPTLLIQDADDPACSLTEILGPLNPCSNGCFLTLDNFDANCDSAGTDTEGSDDFWTIDLNVSAVNGSAGGYNVLVDGVQTTTGAYDVSLSFTLNADGSSPTIEIVDMDDNSCTLVQNLGPLNPCSNGCELTATLLETVCDDNGTDDNPNDDTFMATIQLTGINNSASFDIPSIGLTGAAFDTPVSIGPFDIADGDLVLDIIDGGDATCTVTLIITPPATCSNCTQSLQLVSNGTLSCDMSTVNIDVITDGTVDVASWIGPGTFVSSETDMITVTNPGTYTIEVVYANGCTGVADITIDADSDIPIASVNQDQLLNCDITEVDLDASGSTFPTGSDLVWTNDQGQVISNELVVTVTEPGIYTFQIFNTATGCESEPMTIEVTENMDTPEAVIMSNAGNTLSCDIDAIELTTIEESDVTYTWTVDGNVVTQIPIEITGAAVVELLAVNTISLCEDMTVFVIDDISADPEVEVIESGGVGCDGGQACYQVSSSESLTGFDIQWIDESGDVVFVGSDQFCTSSPGMFTVQVVDIVSNCSFEQSFEIVAPVIAQVSTIDTINLITDDRNVTVEIDIPLDQVAEIIWSPAEAVSCSNCLETTIIGDDLDRVNLTVEIITITGCRSNASIFLTEEIDSEVFVPNVFNPNSSSGNHRFTLYGTETVEEITEILIYDRWGELVWTAENLEPNNIELGWDGRFRGQRAVQGVYAYLIKYRLINGDEDAVAGDVTLLLGN